MGTVLNGTMHWSEAFVMAVAILAAVVIVVAWFKAMARR